MNPLRNILPLLALGVLGGCATASTVPAAMPTLQKLTVAFDPSFDFNHAEMKGETDYVYGSAGNVQRFSTAFSEVLAAKLPSKLAPHGVTVVSDGDTAVTLSGGVQSFDTQCGRRNRWGNVRRLSDFNTGTAVAVSDPVEYQPSASRLGVTRVDYCQTDVDVVMNLIDRSGKKLWSYQQSMTLEDFDAKTFYAFEDQLIAAMAKDGLLAGTR